MGFKEFKKNAKKSTNIEALQEKLQKMNEKKDYTDDRFWYPARDKATKKGSAIIRFLPVSDADQYKEPNGNVITTGGLPWVKTYSHSFKNEANGRWFIEDCPTTVGADCPLCESNSELWNDGSDASKAIARDRKRRLSYIANILVVSDPATPENEGKVFLFKFGKKIFEMIQTAINPEFDDQAPLNVFDMWEGANFALRIGQKDGWTNYDKSEFLASSAISDDDSYLERVYNSMYCLSEFIAPSKFKSAKELQERLDYVLGSATPTRSAAEEVAEEVSYEDSSDYDSIDESDVDDERSAFFEELTKQ